MFVMNTETYIGALVYHVSGNILLRRASLDDSGISGISQVGEEIIQQRASQELRQSVSAPTYAYSFAMFTPSGSKKEESLSSWRFYRMEMLDAAQLPEDSNLAWYNAQQILGLMRRTEQYYLHRDISVDSWRDYHGLSLPWYRLFHEREDLLYPAPVTGRGA